MRIHTHLELLRLDIELTLRALKPYNKYRDVDKYGNELRYNPKTKLWELVNKAFSPFWEATR